MRLPPRRCTLFTDTPSHYVQTAPQVLFLGDSITESWRGTDNCLPCNPRGRSACDAVPAVFSRFWGADSAAAQGIGGDQVAHLIWRMQRGALPKKNPVGAGCIGGCD